MPTDTNMPSVGKQYGCVNCTERTFYVMLQANGDIEVFCVRNNHRQVLVNVERLVRAAFDEAFDKPTENLHEPDLARDTSISD